MLDEAQENGIVIKEPEAEIAEPVTDVSEAAASSTAEMGASIQVSDHSGHAKTHLEQVTEKLQNKLQALTALKSSLKPDSKVLTMLQKEVDSLHEDKKEVHSKCIRLPFSIILTPQVHLHIQRTESWADHLGKWRCRVQSVETTNSSEIDGGDGGGGGGLQARLHTQQYVNI